MSSKRKKVVKNNKRTSTSAQKEFFLPKIVIYIGSFLLPILIMLFVMHQLKFYPFGEKSLLIMDMKDQIVAFMASLRNAIAGDNSLFYSWSCSMGGNYIGLFAFYIASPLSFLTVLFPVEQLPAAIVVLTLLKQGLCGLTCCIYTNAMAARAGKNLGFWAWIPSICYALLSYNIVYSLSPMWLDGVILLPLILLGVEKLLEGSGRVLYLVCLTLLFYSNYYTGYMVGIFTALYVLYRLLCEVSKKTIVQTLQKFGRFVGYSLLCVGMAMPLLGSVLANLMTGKLAAQNINYQPDTDFNYSYGELFSKYSNGNYDSITNAGKPAIYCGYLILLLAVAFLVLKTISLREKIGAVLFLLLFSVCFCYIPLDKIWHGFQYPNWFPYRYAFLACFVLIYMAIRAMCQIDLTKYLTDPRLRLGLSVCLTVIVCVEMGKNSVGLFQGLDKEFGYASINDYDTFMQKSGPLVQQIKKNDTGFYRINAGYEFAKNDAMLLGYNGMTHYSSTFNAAINSLTPRLGISQGYFWNSGYGATPLLNDLFAAKYVLADKTVESSYTKLQSTNQNSTSYSNAQALPIAYGCSGTDLSPDLNASDPFVNQDQFINAILGEQETNTFFSFPSFETETTESGWNYMITANQTGPLYLHMTAQNVSYADIYVDGEYAGYYFTNETNGAMFLGEYDSGQSITVQVVPYAYEGTTASLYETHIAQLDLQKTADTMSTLQKNAMQVKQHSGGKLSGTINLSAGQRVMTSIPYDKGWTVWVDGKKVKIEKYADTFLTFACPAGEHEIRMAYVSPGFTPGCVAAAISLLLLAAVVAWGKARQKKQIEI